MKVRMLLEISFILFLAVIGLRHPVVNPVSNSYANSFSDSSGSLRLAPDDATAKNKPAGGSSPKVQMTTTVNGVPITSSAGTQAIKFNSVSNLTQLMSTIRKSVSANKPVMIYFYATWCPACRAVQSTILPDPAVRQAAQNVTAIGVDCSEHSAVIKQMMDAFHVYAFPTLIYYNKDGTPNAAGNAGAGTSREQMLKVLQQMTR